MIRPRQTKAAVAVLCLASVAVWADGRAVAAAAPRAGSHADACDSVAESAAGSSQGAMAVALVFDMTLPLAHTADGGVSFDPDALEAAVGTAEQLSARREVAVSVALSAETLDALALIGDDRTVDALRAALDGNQLLSSPWTGQDIGALVGAGRGDVVLDGFRRSGQALRWAGVDASSVMFADTPISAPAVALLTGPQAGVTGFFLRQAAPAAPSPAAVPSATTDLPAPPPTGDAAPAREFARPHPVTAVADSGGGLHPAVAADPFLEFLLTGHAAEAEFEPAVCGLMDELLSMAAGGADATALLVPALAPEAVGLLLDLLGAGESLRPMTVDSILAEFAEFAPAGTAAPVGVEESTPSAAETPSAGSFDGYLARRRATEQRLEAYESLLGADSGLAPQLRTLLAGSAARSLAADERLGFLDAIDSQVAEGTGGIVVAAAGRFTITESTAEIPLTVVNGQPVPVTVALEFTSDKIGFPDGDRRVVILEPGRNNLSLDIEAAGSGGAEIVVTATTPDLASRLVLSSRRQQIRHVGLSGAGAFAAVVAVLVLAAWWRRTSRLDGAASSAVTVAATGPGAGQGPDQRKRKRKLRRKRRRQEDYSNHQHQDHEDQT